MTDLFETFRAAQFIAGIPHEKGLYTKDWRSTSGTPVLNSHNDRQPNAYHNQTARGLYFEEYCGTPGNLWTPWGRWDCWGSACGEPSRLSSSLRNFLAEMKTEVFRPAKGDWGAVHAILTVPGFNIPRPELRTEEYFTPYDEAIRRWDEMAQRYATVTAAA
jgi:hypothetical protein